ncbi:MAG: TRAP transporter small permease [Bacteroidetes bacterium]|nr:TRAP transporter small permease [Bacteroidota bacterium]
MFFLKSLDKSISILTKWMIVLIMSLMIVLSFLQILMRNFYGTGIEWGDTFLRHLVLWIGLLGAVVATSENRHISVEVITKFISQKVKKLLSIVVSIFAAFICIVLFYASYNFLQLEIETAEILFLNIPRWYFILVIPIGYLIIAFRFILIVINRTIEVVNKNWSIPETHQ